MGSFLFVVGELGAGALFTEAPYPDDRILLYLLGCFRVCFLKLGISVLFLFSGIKDLSLGRLFLFAALPLLGLSAFGNPTFCELFILPPFR